MAIITTLINLLLTTLAAHTLYHTIDSIRNLQQYEDTAKRAAKYSNIASDELRHTRTTQGAAAISISLSLLASTYLIFATTSIIAKFILSILNVVVLEFSRRHVQSYWSSKHRVPLPGTKEYNEAMRKTQGVVLEGVLYLEFGWVVGSILGVLL